MTASTSAAAVARSMGPQTEHALSFGAQTLLVSMLVVALGAPVFYAQGVADSPTFVAEYALGGAALPIFSALLMWRMRWGAINGGDARRLVQGSVMGAAPALLAALWIVSVGQGRALIGVSVMAFIAALLFVVVSERQGSGRMQMAPALLVYAAIFATPTIILSMTQMLPHGVSVIAGWAIPIPVAAMGAVGAAYALKGCSRARTKEAGQ